MIRPCHQMNALLISYEKCHVGMWIGDLIDLHMTILTVFEEESAWLTILSGSELEFCALVCLRVGYFWSCYATLVWNRGLLETSLEAKYGNDLNRIQSANELVLNT